MERVQTVVYFMAEWQGEPFTDHKVPFGLSFMQILPYKDKEGYLIDNPYSESGVVKYIK